MNAPFHLKAKQKIDGSRERLQIDRGMTNACRALPQHPADTLVAALY
jgi:hypothetical protein